MTVSVYRLHTWEIGFGHPLDGISVKNNAVVVCNGRYGDKLIAAIALRAGKVFNGKLVNPCNVAIASNGVPVIIPVKKKEQAEAELVLVTRMYRRRRRWPSIYFEIPSDAMARVIRQEDGDNGEFFLVTAPLGWLEEMSQKIAPYYGSSRDAADVTVVAI